MSDTKDWYKKRHYLHFDQPIGLNKATKIVTSPESVSRHSFSPFINYQIQSHKIYKKDGKVEYKSKSRPIAFAAHVDSHIYSYYCQKLTALYEAQLKGTPLDRSILAFRKLGKSNIDFAFDAFVTLP